MEYMYCTAGAAYRNGFVAKKSGSGAEPLQIRHTEESLKIIKMCL